MMAVRRNRRLNGLTIPRPPLSKLGDIMATKTKEAGMAQAFENANEKWKEAVEKRIRFLMANKRYFTSDDIMIYLTDRNIKTHNNSAIGSFLNKYSNRGYIQEAGFVISQRPSRHKAPIRLWKSKLYRKGVK